jgi:hypothetical protein
MPPFPIVLLPLTLPLGIVRVAFEEEAHVIRSIYISIINTIYVPFHNMNLMCEFAIIIQCNLSKCWNKLVHKP